jgi:release factor glutamine methyltransferase
MRGSDLVARGTATLVAAEVPDAGRDARRLLAHVLKIAPGRLTLYLPDEIAPEIEVLYAALIDQRAARVPVSHLTGQRQFYGRDFKVTSDVLDPRPETETLIEAALAEPFKTVLDLGTGSGCILLTLLSERPHSIGVGIDLSAAALQVAQDNRGALDLEHRAAFEEGSWFAPLEGVDQRFDLIVSNPPYIALDEMPDLSPEVRNNEPRMALTDEGDGLAAYRLICAGVGAYLAENGRLMVEIGPTQGAAVAEMMAQAGLDDVRVVTDLDGRDRVVLARHSAKSH